jgi:hydroxymethylpyrimidine pyrophosphatase-like HAD family hydrolase
MTKTLMDERFGVDLDAERAAYVFIGDSPNDAPLFAYFSLSVGVANVRAAAHRIEHPPAFVTASASGAGFVELTERLLALRHG